MLLDYLILFVGSYLLGSVPFAIIFAKTRGVNLFKSGSGNPGSSNVLASTKSIPLTAAVFIADSLKGILPVLVAKWTGMPDHIAMWCGVLAIFGHAYSVFAGFRGGRGVLTAMGSILALHFWSGIILLIVVFAIFTPIFRNQPLGVFICYLIIPFFPFIFQYTDQSFWMFAALVFLVFVSLGRRLVFVKRRSVSQDLPNSEVFWNRLLFDRDIRDKKIWMTSLKN